MQVKTRLARGIRRALAYSGMPTLKDLCEQANARYNVVLHYVTEDEPAWLRELREIKRLSGLTWDDILGR